MAARRPNIDFNFSVDKESIKAVSSAIMLILHAKCEEQTKVAALDVLKGAARIEGVSVAGCHVTTRN